MPKTTQTQAHDEEVNRHGFGYLGSLLHSDRNFSPKIHFFSEHDDSTSSH